MVRRWLGVLFVSLALLACPSVALAEDGSLLESFTGGFTDTVTGEARAAESDPVREYEYEPVLHEVQTREIEDETDTQGYIEQVTNRMNSVPHFNGNQNYSLLDSILYFLGNGSGNHSTAMRALILIPAVGIVFMWWGLRKTLRIIMSAFRSGRMSLGGSWSTSRYNPRSYYFGMRKRDL